MSRGFAFWLLLLLGFASGAQCSWLFPTLDEKLRYAALEGKVAEVQLLLEKGAGTEAQDTARSLFAHFLQHLLTVLDEDTQNGVTALMLAANNGHVEVVSLLLDKGANMEAQNKVRCASGTPSNTYN